MDVAVISAMAAIAGSSVGALATFATTWLVQTSQLENQQKGARLAERQKLYKDFISEAAKRMTDALSHDATEPLEVLVLLIAYIGQMRLFSSPAVVTSAEQVARLIVDFYLAPRRSLKELREAFMDDAKLDALGQFAAVCRKDLDGAAV